MCDLGDKMDVLWSFIKNHLKKKILIFMSSCKQVRLKLIYCESNILSLTTSLVEKQASRRRQTCTVVNVPYANVGPIPTGC